MMMSALSKKYKNKIWETGAGHYCLVLVESRHICIFYKLCETQCIFGRLNFFYPQTARVFHNFYQIMYFKSISGTHRSCGSCATEYSFLKRNIYGFFQNFSRIIFVRYNTNSTFLLKMSGFESSDTAYNLWLKSEWLFSEHPVRDAFK